MNKYIIANWKMKVTSLKDATTLLGQSEKLASENTHIDMIICPSPMHLGVLARESTVKKLKLGAQNISIAENGAYTGETSIASLADMGIKYTLIGHSERRAMGETDADCAQKIKLAIAHGVQPILCIGESARDDNGAHYAFIEKQLQQSLSGIPVEALRSIMIAYEPIWAISSTQNAQEAKPEDIQEMVNFIHKVLADLYGVQKLTHMRILYGGSVNPDNIADYINLKDVSGVLVGSASVKEESLRSLVEKVG